jgi:hypothetical protein
MACVVPALTTVHGMCSIFAVFMWGLLHGICSARAVFVHGWWSALTAPTLGLIMPCVMPVLGPCRARAGSV